MSLNSFVFYDSFFWAISITAGIFGFLINFASYLQIRFTSPLSHNVSGTAKAATQTVIALYGMHFVRLLIVMIAVFV